MAEKRRPGQDASRPDRIGLLETEKKRGWASDRGSVSAEQAFAFYRRLKTPIWVFDIDNTRLVFANDAACTVWRAENEQELLNRDFAGDMSKTVSERLKQYQKSFIAEDKDFSELWSIFPKGQPVPVKVSFTGFLLDDGRVAMLCEAQSGLVEEPETVRSAEALMHTDVMITLFDRAGEALYANPSSRRSMLEAADALRARFGSTRLHARILKVLGKDREFNEVLEVRTAAGKRWHNVSIKSCSDGVTGKAAFLVTEIDVTELKAAQVRESYLALHDSLTGLYNRSFVQTLIEDPEAFQRKHATLAAILYIDIDRFKFINDTHGHEFGDAVLVTVARRISAELRPVDAVSRLGGDEFIVLINNTGEDLDAVAARIRARIGEPIGLGENAYSVSCSIGIARHPHDGKHFDILMRHADLALYAAKKAGRRTHCFFTSDMHEEAEKRNNLETDLVRAIKNKEFVLHYQPRVEVGTNRIVGLEALVRWNHGQRGLISPGDFIPLCEETGLIEPLGEEILVMAARQQAQWARAGHKVFVSVNLSPRQFHSERLMPLIREIASSPGVNPDLLELEITETVLMGDSEQFLATLTEIRKLGFHMALDDFGTGYSNLAYIPRYPIGCIKIDKSFIDQLPHSSAVIGLILSLGKQIGAKVVAEGVETMAQLQHLQRAGCAEYQGYLFERPQTVDRITALLQRRAGGSGLPGAELGDAGKVAPATFC